MAATATRGQGKTSFVKEILNDNPYANARAVNEAWQGAGMDGTISDTLVNKMRSQLGLAGNLRGRRRPQTETTAREKPAYTGKKRGRKPKRATGEATGGRAEAARARADSRKDLLVDLEADFDRLLFKVMNAGGLTKIENALRETRRLLYGSFSSRHS